MSHNSRIRAPGLWTLGSVIAPSEMEAFDARQNLSIHEGGGTWALTSNVIMGAAASQTWTFTCPVVFSGGVTLGSLVDSGAAERTTLENNSTTVYGLRDFVAERTLTYSGTIPNSDSDNVTVWTTPSQPYIIEGAIISLTGTATATSDPTDVTFALTLKSYALINDCVTSTPWGGSSYGVNPISNASNKIVWGLDATDRGALLSDGGYIYTGLAGSGSLGSDKGFAAITAGNGTTDGFWGADVMLNIKHSAGAPVSFTAIPLKIQIFGRLLG